MIKCPNCSTDMNESFTSGGVVIDNCPSCRGTWLDEGEIMYMVRNRKEMKKVLEQGLISPHGTDRECPRCHVKMVEGGLAEQSLQVDECSTCKGMFFDGSELDTLNSILSKSKIEKPATRALVSPLAMTALPNLGFRAAGVLIGLYAMLFGVMIFLVETQEIPASVGIGFYVVFIVLNFLLAPWLMDLSLQWMQRMRWVDPHELPEHLRIFLTKVCSQKNVPLPKIGIIDDGNPNAFTYGRTPRDARLVFTAGLINILDEDELEAVAAHEMGHILHWDMLVMTVASLVPMILYSLYRMASRASRSSGGSSRNSGKGQGAALMVALIAYIAYVISQYLVLFLSRVREYYADRFAGEITDNPDALSRALVKIAYGLAGAPQAEDESERSDSALAPAQALGIFNAVSAKALAATALRGDGFDKDAMLGAMQWDLWNPWAGFYEINSTHPLPAKRIEALSQQTEAMGMEPMARFDLTKPESYWDEFAIDVLFMAAPFLAGAAGFLTGMAGGGGANAVGRAVLWLGFGMLLRTWYSYRNDAGFMPMKVASLVRIIKVSGIRSVPVKLRGKIIGRGVPGHILSEDMVLQDESGFIFLDYRQPIRIMELLFGLFRTEGIIGQQVEIEGYFRRSPMPYIEMMQLRLINGPVHKCYVKAFKFFASAVVIAGGLLIMMV